MNQGNFEYITEELNKLMKQFVADSNDGYDGLSDGIIRTIVRSACRDMAEKAATESYNALHGFVKSNIFTRWYWRRRMKKAEKQLDNAMAFCNEMNKLINEQKQ